MLNIGHVRCKHCSGMNRRELLQVGTLGALGLSLSDLLRMEAGAAETSAPAKSVILLWLWGGPSHLDTFDLKPNAPVEYRGPYAPISTSVPGTNICEMLPKLAKRADRYSILRSMHHNSIDHGIAGTIGLTGSDTGAKSLSGQVLQGQVQPNHGAVVAKVLGSQPTMPGFVTLGGFLHQGKQRITGEGGGALASLHDPFRLDYDPEQGVKIPQLELVDGVTPDGMTARKRLLASLEGLTRQAAHSSAFDQFDQFYQQAFSLLTSNQARRVFDLEQEPQRLRREYGRFRFGQCCLMARRLVEAGCRFVQVNWSSHVEPVEDTGDGGWDLHHRNFQQFQDRHSWMLDQSLSALLDDLEQRGLSDETLVVAVGEFGRSPKINGEAGRDHWNKCYSALVSGGGLRDGQIVGSSDRHGKYPSSRPVVPADLFLTVLERLGIGTADLTGVGLTPSGELIEELI